MAARLAVVLVPRLQMGAVCGDDRVADAVEEKPGKPRPGELTEQAPQLRPVGLVALRHFAKHPAAPGLLQRCDLGVDHDPRFSVSHCCRSLVLAWVAA